VIGYTRQHCGIDWTLTDSGAPTNSGSGAPPAS
jgi:hypothetical protein